MACAEASSLRFATTAGNARMSDFVLNFHWVDVFAAAAYGGNPLPVVFGADGLADAALLRITQEFRQFETAFVFPTDTPERWRARIFDLFEELPFAGHPLLGAAVVVHALHTATAQSSVEFLLGERVVRVESRIEGHSGTAWLDAGLPQFLTDAIAARDDVANAFALAAADLHDTLPIQTVSTGLRYLIVPVQGEALEKARIDADIGDLVRAHGAEFAVLIDPQAREQRHWNNDGKLEDYATGSAASVVGAYLARHGVLRNGEVLQLKQGRHAGRPSEILVRVDVSTHRVHIGGRVQRIGGGRLLRSPE
jgi:trans-2,3-dihydro-3-hydroxyanthranilate isomerase